MRAYPILLSVTLAVYAFMLLVTIPEVMQHSNGMKILDLMPGGYSAEYVRKLFDTLGESGRDAYLFRQLPVDFAYPGLFMATFCLTIRKIYSRLPKFSRYAALLSISALLGGAFDYLENVGVVAMLLRYPNDLSAIAPVSSAFSVAKSVFSSFAFSAIAFGLASLGYAGLKSKKDAP